MRIGHPSGKVTPEKHLYARVLPATSGEKADQEHQLHCRLQ